MVTSTCKTCGGSFRETYKGARVVDLCVSCIQRRVRKVTHEPSAPQKAPSGSFVIVHAWQWDGEDQTYADPSTDRVDGWCVYLRVPSGEPGDFDIPLEEDFATLQEAEAWATEVARAYGLHPVDDVHVEL